MEVDYRLYLVTERSILGDKSLEDAVTQAIEGGVGLVQLREKEISTRNFYEIAWELKKVTDKYKVPLIINDRIDVAQAIDAAGVHLGQKDMPLAVARKILGKDKIIGISVENVAEAREAEDGRADYLGVGTVFYTGSKKDINVPIGLEGLREIISNCSLPTVAIGGINDSNIKDVIATGVNGVAVISAILGKKDIKEAANSLRLAF